ncbi:MAG: DUF898 domain-containing protein [Candidatus Accumulibacter sp.]|jgi:uncharacterized membrane protein YjgN (DUF898 family)|nr:DUF898 domain-containing protein [Accumulibacter sp.]
MPPDAAGQTVLGRTFPAPAAEPHVEHRLRFAGSGSEYFRIWIVNLLLSIVTLGIYSAWAKARREQYFHRNTLLDGSGFDYHGDPKAILKGRVIAVALLAVLSLIDRMEHDLYYPALLAASPLVPWLMIRSFVFRARNTSYRGLHFDFRGTYKDFCKTFLAPLVVLLGLGWLAALAMPSPGFGDDQVFGFAQAIRFPLLMAAAIASMLLIPVLWHRFKAFQFNHLAFGASRFESDFRLKSFFWIFLRLFFLAVIVTALLIVAPLVVFILRIKDSGSADFLSALFGSWFLALLPLFVLPAYILLFFMLPAYFQALLTNLVWNHTRLDGHGFRSDQTLGGVFKIVFTNWLLLILTLGFYWPWAKVRMARYRAEHMAVLAAGGLDDFIGAASPERSAYGEEIADVFDFDLGF